MSGTEGTKRRIVAASSALMVVVGLLAAFAGSASAAPLAPATSVSAQWAYGGSNSSGGSVTVGNLTATWSASIGVDVVFNATPTVTNVTELEAQRTVGVSIQITLSSPNGTVSFSFKGLEVDTAFANITNASTVNESGTIVPALGILNSSFHGTGSIAEALLLHGTTKSASAFLNVSAAANAAVEFTPALGVVPLTFADGTSWSSMANATPSANWNISYAYAFHGWNNTSLSGSGARNGSWNASGPVVLNGELITLGLPHFHDHISRVAVLLTVSGPANLYDGFIVIPRGFDLFGGAHHDYDAYSLSNVTISSDRLFLTHGHIGASSLTASQVTVGGQGGAQPLVASTGAHATPSASPVGGNVVAEPMSVSQAQSQAQCLQKGCPGAGPAFSGLAAAALIGALVAAVAGTVGVVEWRSYARRKNRATQLVGGYSEGMATGVPPAVVQPPASPAPPTGGPSNLDGPNRQL